MLARRYEMPWRPASEAWAAFAYLAAALLLWLGVGPRPLASLLLVVCLTLAAWRLRQARVIWRHRLALAGRAIQMIGMDRLERRIADPEHLFLGFGFQWQPVHSQRLYELSKLDVRTLAVPPACIPLLGRHGPPQPDSEIGLPYIHGVEIAEQPLYRPLSNFEGGTAIVGTTQSGKGVALANLITQAVRRGDVVIVIDPKNSSRLRRVVQQACLSYRAPDTFLYFHPAFPEAGVRLDFTYNWQKATEIASRVQAIMPPDTGGAFTAFGWDAVNVVVGGLVDLEVRPNLMNLARGIEGGIEPVLEESLRRFYLRTLGEHWRAEPAMAALFERVRSGALRPPTAAASPELVAMVVYYEQHLPAHHQDKVIDAQVRTFRHNREHYQKITANLLPVLSMLTSGDLGRSLSPDPFDPEDARPIMNFERIEQGGHVLYMCLDSLPDPSVASAIGALALADLAARAGMRYNLGIGRRISLFVDEVSNVINQPLIEILNKGAESGLYTTVAMQTIADLAVRLGSMDAARVALGNLNNLIAFRSKDSPTQEFIIETFGKTGVHSIRMGINSGSDVHVGDFSSGTSTMLTETLEDVVPAAMLGRLPNLQYFASVAGGRLLKGRFTLLDPDRPPPVRATPAG